MGGLVGSKWASMGFPLNVKPQLETSHFTWRYSQANYLYSAAGMGELQEPEVGDGSAD